MDLRNQTEIQHFVPVVEQKLNAINPSAKKDNQKIYSFSLDDRESYAINLDKEKGNKISNTLKLNDIFSFDVLGKKASRYNFEKLFYQYEASIEKNTESLLSKLPKPGEDIKSEIFNIFLSKFLNFFRNPFSIKKILNTFPQLKNVHPTDPVHYNNFERILNGRKPHQAYLCKQLGITEQEYTDWLAVIFLLLTPLEKDQPNFLEQVVKDLYENPDSFIMVLIYTYDDKTCLLSDRGYSIPLPENEHMAWDFNLYSHGFIRYVFGNLDLLAPATAPKELVEKFKAEPKSIDVHNIVNDLNALEQYNKHVVYQCNNNVFNSSTECYGL
ncbi:hypothetical protein PCIT_a1430 [Pseudoalteromonas citrea]|uniref:Uncharacterized protein n=2 Tax=Pseudoalteromonas citrea TaxID=43655 RepID=A0AAD4FTQ0_9GAMM|nr:hypothetical protein [Pseudoalteromonas citrea]KAF7775273.1 hypothetical protein PCIT_a1430 [Pseudoalteromonas citrea]